MIDLHIHILPGIDDGAEDWEEALEMLRMAAADGVTAMIATPHFRDFHKSDRTLKNKILKQVEEINERAQKEGISVRVYAGAENRAVENLPSFIIEHKTALSLSHNHRYVLVEFPLYEVPAWAELLIFQCLVEGMIPIIAHPERNRDIIKTPQILYDFVVKGALAQLDTPSLEGQFGSEIQKLSERLIKCQLIHFIGSDAHNAVSRVPLLSRAYERVKELVGEEMAHQLFVENPSRVIEGVDIVHLTPRNPANRFEFFFSRYF